MRPIDADALKDKVLNWMPSDPCGIAEKEHPIETDIVASLMMEIEEAPTIEQPTWIPCSERLPSNFSEDETVLVTTGVDGDRVILMFAFDVKSFYLKGYISAWMPLPKPWKGADDEVR